MQRSMLTRLSTALIIPAMVLLSSAAAAQDATPEAATDRATAAELEQMLGPLPTPSEPWKICAIEKTLINEHWQQMKQGYEDAAAEYGVEVEVQASRDEADLTGQLAIAETMLQGDCDAFAVSPLSSSNLQPFLDRAKEAGIPLINVDDAKVEIYHLIDRLARAGAGILLISSELPEILGLSDRIAVMRQGRIVDQCSRAEATEERIVQAAMAG